MESGSRHAKAKQELGANYKTTFGAAAPDEASVAGKNIALAEAHLAELTAIGIGTQQ